MYCVSGLVPGPRRALPFFRRQKKTPNVINATKKARPPTVPPTMAPVFALLLPLLGASAALVVVTDDEGTVLLALLLLLGSGSGLGSKSIDELPAAEVGRGVTVAVNDSVM